MSRSLSSALRPYLNAQVKPRQRDAYLRFYAAATATAAPNHKATSKPTVADPEASVDSLWSSASYRKRLKQLTALHPEGQNAPTEELYPRIGPEKRLKPAQFRREAEKLRLAPGTWSRSTKFSVQGKVWRARSMGKKLLFIDVVESEERVQVMVDMATLQKKAACSLAELDDLRRRLAVGDYYAFTGCVTRTAQGELTLAAEEMPKLLSPSLHVLPTQVTDRETLARLPQLDLLLHQSKRDLLRLRHVIEKSISEFLDHKDFTKVTTPILAADTGGAAAQPFETATNEIPDVPLRLRIAPELALKKLTAANLGPVYEIGPCFRNEGLDSTHNPEFSTCEFYKPFASLDELMTMTETMLLAMGRSCQAAIGARLKSLPKQETLELYFSSGQFARLPFVPTLSHEIRKILPTYRLPRNMDEAAAPELISLIHDLQMKVPNMKLKVPSNATTARLLDYLCSHLVEPLCQSPTFITDHPAVMSPLAKSYVDSATGYTLSARAELFINGIEYVNLYEEENSPFQQARNFLSQAHNGSTSVLKNQFGVDRTHEEIKQRLTPGQQYYVRVLEMGLPPTGGWGCGLERLVMLFGGAKRIGDVLPFGGLRSVVAMGTTVDAKGGLVIEKDIKTDI